MTLTFKNSDGVECVVLIRRFEPGDERDLRGFEADEDDLRLAGFIRLATGSDGMHYALLAKVVDLCRRNVESFSGESYEVGVLERAVVQLAAGRVLLSTEGGPTDEEIDHIYFGGPGNADGFAPPAARRALFAAGSASREAAILAELSEAFGERREPFTSVAEVRESVRGFMIALREATNERETAKAEVDRLTARVAELNEERLRDLNLHEEAMVRAKHVRDALRDRAEYSERRVGWLRAHRRRLNAKLERVERERDIQCDALDLLMEREDRAKTELARERDEARSELERARRVVEAARDLCEDYRIAVIAGCRADGWSEDSEETQCALAGPRRLKAALDAFTSAAPAVTRRDTDGHRSPDPDPVRAGVPGAVPAPPDEVTAADRTEAPFFTSWTCPLHKCGIRASDPNGLSGRECSGDHDRGGFEHPPIAMVPDPTSKKPPRAEAGESGPVCDHVNGWKMVGDERVPFIGYDCTRCGGVIERTSEYKRRKAEESKPEPCDHDGQRVALRAGGQHVGCKCKRCGEQTEWIPQDEDAEMVASVTAVVREADRAFEESGGGSRHWVREQFLPRLNTAGLFVCRAEATESKPELCHRCGSPANVNDGDDGMGPPVCVRCYSAEESKPEPQPSDDAPEPSASVSRSEVEALRDEVRQQRDDWEKRLELIGPSHAEAASSRARYRVWGYVHECLEELLSKEPS